MPFEGSTLQCDARKTPQCDAGQSEAEGGCLFTPVVCFIARLSPLSSNRPLRPSGTSPNLEEESGVWLTFRFQVSSSHPLCPSKIGGRGATLRRGSDKRKCENGNVKGAVSLQTVIVIRTPYSVLCTLYSVICTLPQQKRPQTPVVQVIIQSSLVSWQET